MFQQQWTQHNPCLKSVLSVMIKTWTSFYRSILKGQPVTLWRNKEIYEETGIYRETDMMPRIYWILRNSRSSFS